MDTVSLVHADEHFRRVPPENRNKRTFLAAIGNHASTNWSYQEVALDVFQARSRGQRGHVEFLNAALKHLKEYNLQKDLDTYKALLNVFPKGPLIPKNTWQV